MNRSTIYTGIGMGAAAIAGAAMLAKPRKSRRMKKALKTVSAAVNSFSNMIG